MDRVELLLIEDDPDYRTLVESWLASSREVRFCVRWAARLDEAWTRIDCSDVILLDGASATVHFPRAHVLRVVTPNSYGISPLPRALPAGEPRGERVRATAQFRLEMPPEISRIN